MGDGFGAQGVWSEMTDSGTALNDLAIQINETSTSHGFWPEEGRNMGEMLMLAVSELAEALEEHRSGRPAVWYQPANGLTGAELDEHHAIRYINGPELGLNEINHIVAEGFLKPEGIAVELADCIIRCLDTLQSLGVDIDQVVKNKMAYNRTRPHKHGRKY